MTSKYLCTCGETVRTNLFSGHELLLLFPEGELDIDSDCISIDQLFHAGEVVAECQKFGRIALIDSEYNIRLYASIANEAAL